jgi:hypothetical protein
VFSIFLVMFGLSPLCAPKGPSDYYRFTGSRPTFPSPATHSRRIKGRLTDFGFAPKWD